MNSRQGRRGTPRLYILDMRKTQFVELTTLKYKELQTIIAMINEDKDTELFCMADEFCRFLMR